MDTLLHRAVTQALALSVLKIHDCLFYDGKYHRRILIQNKHTLRSLSPRSISLIVSQVGGRVSWSLEICSELCSPFPNPFKAMEACERTLLESLFKACLTSHSPSINSNCGSDICQAMVCSSRKTD